MAMLKMSIAAYNAMKKRLREVLQHSGVWTNEEVEEVAAFVEREAVLYAAQVQTELKEKAMVELHRTKQRRKN